MEEKNFTTRKLSDKARAILAESKEGSISAADINLAGMIDYDRFSSEYFGKNGAWFESKLRATSLFDKENGFSQEEADVLVAALRDLSSRMAAHATAIATAPLFDDSDEKELPED